MAERKKVLVLGAGYAGLQTVTKLQKNYQNKTHRLL